MICPNLKDPVVKKQFDKLTEVLGEPTAYLVWHKNNGNYLDKESNGNDSVLWNKLISKYSEEDSIKLKSKVFSSEFKPSVVPLERVKFDYNKPAGEQSRAARDNAKLDLMRSILTNSDTFSKAINPGNFDVLKEFASHDNEDSIAYRKGIKSGGLKIASPRANREIFVRNMTGKAILGIFVNHSVNHAITQHSDLSLSESIELDGKYLKDLNQQKNSDGKYISRLLGMFVGASADNAKEPVASDLNISTFTVDILATMLRVGYPLDTALYFINQPVIVALSEEYALEGYDSAEYYNVFNKIKAKYINVESAKTADITKDMLKNDIGKASGDIAFQQRQVALLEMFDKVKTQAQSLGKLISVMRPDDTKRQIISSTNEVYMTNLAEVMSSEAFSNVESVFEKYPLLHTFYTNAVENSLIELNKWFPWNKPALLSTKASIKTNIPSYKRLSSEVLEKINMEFLNFMVTNFEFFQHDKKESIIKKYPQQFKNYVSKNNLKDDALLSRLRVDKVDGTNLNVISLNSSSSMSDVDKAKISDAWSELLETHPEFAKDLIRYTYHSHGFVINPKTFSHLIPVEFYRGLYDSNKLHFNDYLNSFIGDLDSSISFDNFVDQFFRNNWEDKQVVPQITSDGKKVPKGVIMSNGVPVKLELNREDHRNFVNKFYEDSVDFVDYITLSYDKKKYLFKQTTKSGEYIKVEPLGIKNVIKEYDLNQSDLKSIFSDNTVKQVVPSKTPQFDMLPASLGKPTMTYAGIGSRETPPEVLEKMTKIAKYLENQGYKLNTGKTFGNKEEGADKAFSDGAKNKTLFAPESIADDSVEVAVAKEMHPNPTALKPGGLKLMARNTNQIFGADLKTPVDFVLFWAEETNTIRPKGGTGQAVEMARRKGIPTINLKDPNWRDKLLELLNVEKPTEQPKAPEATPQANIDETDGDNPFGVQSNESFEELPFDPDKDSILNLTPEQRAKFEALVKDKDTIGATVPQFMKGLTPLQREALRYEMQHKEITFKC